ncbi:hypothetical protein ACFLVX_02020 [Chloroflexota bacterium]
MNRKEAIIRYLGHVGRGNRHQIAESIGARPELVSVKLTELRRAGIVRKAEWFDRSRVWVLSEKGARRFDYYRKRDIGKA